MVLDDGGSIKMRNRVMTLMVVLVGVFVTTCRPVLAQGQAAVAPMHVHHVHLNSVDPKAAADYYLKPFPVSTTRTTFNGYEAIKTGNVYLLFTKVDTAPQTELTGPQTSIWHFGWNTPDSRKYNEDFHAKGLKIAQMWDAADGKLVDMSSDTLPGLPTQEQILEMRGKGVQPTRKGGFGYLRGPDGAMIENAQSSRTVQPHPHVSREPAVCDSVVRCPPRRDRSARQRGQTPCNNHGRLQTALRPADVAIVRQVSRFRSRAVR
jgi:hypothetical protein